MCFLFFIVSFFHFYCFLPHRAFVGQCPVVVLAVQAFFIHVRTVVSLLSFRVALGANNVVLIFVALTCEMFLHSIALDWCIFLLLYLKGGWTYKTFLFQTQ